MIKFITSEVRFNFVNLWEPKSFDGGEAKYSVSLIIPKSDTKLIQDIKIAIETLAEDWKELFGGEVPQNLKIPLRDADLEGSTNPAYKDSYFINASSKFRIRIVDGTLKPILDQKQFYSGCYGRAAIIFYCYNIDGNMGVGCGLQEILKISDGEPLGGKIKAESDFDVYVEDGGISK